jgi:hypothetical protein
LKVNREVMRRLEAAEKKLAPTIRVKYVVRDFDEYFFGDCGFELSQEEFDAWLKQQEPEVKVTIIKYTVDGTNFLDKTCLNNLREVRNKPPLKNKDQSKILEAFC